MKRFFYYFFYISLLLNITELMSDDEQDIYDFPLEDLQEMKISSAGKINQKISEIPSSVLIVTRHEIEMYGYTSLTEILENVSGFYNIETYGFGGSNLGIRGYWPSENNNNVKILLNGLELTNLLQNASSFDKINVAVESIDRIEIVRGPNSILYGSNAFLGLINIITNETDFRDNKTAASITAGSYSTYHAYLGRSEKGRDFRYSLNASYKQTSGFDHKFEDMVSTPAVLNLFNIDEGETTAGKLDKHDFSVDFTSSFLKFYLKFYFTEAMNEWMYFIPSTNKGTKNHSELMSIMAGYKGDFSHKLSYDFNVQYITNSNYFALDILSKHYYGNVSGEIKNITTEANIFWKPRNDLFVTLGSEYSKSYKFLSNNDLPGEFAEIPERYIFQLKYPDNSSEDIISSYVEVIYSFADHFKLISGLRSDFLFDYTIDARVNRSDQDGYGTASYRTDIASPQILPKTALIYDVTDRSVIKAVMGASINRPAPLDFAERMLFMYDEEALENEVMTALEIDWSYFQTDHSHYSISAYYNQIENMVMRSVSNFLRDGVHNSYPINTNSVQVIGLELITKLKIYDAIGLQFSFNYMHTSYLLDELKDITVGYSPELLSSLNLNYSYRDFSLALYANYTGGMKPYYDTELSNENNPSSYRGRIGEEVPAYINLNANLTARDVIIDNLSVNLKFTNLLDQQIRYPVYMTNAWADRGMLGSDLSMYFRITYGLD